LDVAAAAAVDGRLAYLVATGRSRTCWQSPSGGCRDGSHI